MQPRKLCNTSQCCCYKAWTTRSKSACSRSAVAGAEKAGDEEAGTEAGAIAEAESTKRSNSWWRRRCKSFHISSCSCSSNVSFCKSNQETASTLLYGILNSSATKHDLGIKSIKALGVQSALASTGCMLSCCVLDRQRLYRLSNIRLRMCRDLCRKATLIGQDRLMVKCFAVSNSPSNWKYHYRLQG